MFAIGLNITWIYLVSVSVFLFLFRLLSLQNLLTLVSYSSNFCISPYSKKNMFVLIPTAWRQLLCPVCPLCIHFLSADVLYVNSVPYHPCRLSSSDISFSPVDAFSLETLCYHFYIVFPIIPNPLSPLTNSFVIFSFISAVLCETR